MSLYSIDDLRGFRADVESELDSLKTSLVELQSRYDVKLGTRQALDTTIQWLESLEERMDAERNPIPDDIDFDGARNVFERLVRVAERTDGVIKPPQVADALIAAGLSTSKRRVLASAVYRTLNEHKDDFQRIEPGVYRYIGSHKPPIKTAFDLHDIEDEKEITD